MSISDSPERLFVHSLVSTITEGTVQSLDLIFYYEEPQLNVPTRELDGLIDEAASFDRLEGGRVIVCPKRGTPPS